MFCLMLLLQLVVLLVKADTIDVNVAGSLRFTSQDWEAAAEVFSQELAGVQLVDKRQVGPWQAGLAHGMHRGAGLVGHPTAILQLAHLLAWAMPCTPPQLPCCAVCAAVCRSRH